jgi:hypothetical protein
MLMFAEDEGGDTNTLLWVCFVWQSHTHAKAQGQQGRCTDPLILKHQFELGVLILKVFTSKQCCKIKFLQH